MTIEQRLEQVEQENQKIQRTKKRLTVALTMMAVTICAVVTMAATGLKDGDFDTVVANRVTARHIAVVNDAFEKVVIMGPNPSGDGYLMTISAKDTPLVYLSTAAGGNGAVTTYQPNGKELVDLSSGDNGGIITVSNKTGEGIAQMYADDYGNGVVWAGNRKGNGRTLKPGP